MVTGLKELTVIGEITTVAVISAECHIRKLYEIGTTASPFER